jgi:hypothetical protein
MQRRFRQAITATVVVGAVCAIEALSAPAARAQSMQYQSVRNTRGSITGVVSDDHGGPIAGAMVSALGTVTVATLTDATGYFSIDALPTGDYTVQAHRTGFVGSARATVRVSGLSPALHRLQLRRLNAPVATTGTTPPVPTRPIMAAGFGLPAGTLADQPDASETSSDTTVARDDHPHSETAWRLRHIKRSILKDQAPIVTVVEGNPEFAPGSLFERAMDSAASMATTFFTDLPFSGEVNLLTTGAFGPGEMFSGDLLPRGVAYMAIGAPTPAGDWSVRAAMNQGDLSSWIVAGAFQSRGAGADAAHVYRFGYTYSAQDYLGGNPAALMAATDGSRNVGELFALDRWSITKAIAVEYGGRYGRYDYLRPGGLFSPKVGVTVEPFKATRVSATVAQRMVAPGAEEFVASETPGPWLPPERTFAPLGGPGPGNMFSVERARYLDLLVEHAFESNYAVGLRRFYQSVDDQLVTLFGLNVPGGPQSVGHYYVANAGSLDADGWALRVSTTSKRVTGSIDYSVTRARWLGRGDMADIAAWAPAAIRAETEDLHDVTTSVATDIPETATRVFVFYKINTGYTRSDTSQLRAGLDARFDVQINQSLPFELGGTRWEVLVGLRNLFRDPNDPASVYDELLVVRPPKRVVGGFLVRF